MAELLISILLTLISLYALLKGADYLIDGASDIAKWLKVSPLLVGLTVVAFGTSLPEFIVSIFSVFSGSADIGIGTIVGSNIANLAIGIGVSALLVTLHFKSKTLIYEIPFLLVSNVLLIILANDLYLFGLDTFTLGRIDGVLFITVFAIFIYYIFKSMKEDKKKLREPQNADNSIFKNCLLVGGGLTALLAGGHIFVTSASEIAVYLGVSEAFVGLTVAAIGTSLPEIIASIMAAYKRQSDLAIGNILGSNVFNILFVLGATSLAKPFSVNPSVLAIDSMVLLGIILLFILFASSGKKLSRYEGITILSVYALYLVFLFWRL